MKAIVLLSGGLDSATCLAVAVESLGAANVIALSVYYGQRHKKEVEAAKALTEYYGVKWRQLDMTEVFRGCGCSLLESSADDIPEKSYADQLRENNGDPVTTYVPFRNGLFISAAASIALAEGCGWIYCGIHKDDAAGNAYPDCSADFYHAMDRAIYSGSGDKVRLIAPFVNDTKADIVKKGLALGVPFNLTWSCYKGGEKPCGVCGTCRDRINAFLKNGVKDPLRYQNED